MSTPSATPSLASNDLIDRLTGLVPGGRVHQVRHARDKVVAATQGSYEALFDPGLADLSLAERLAVAVHACELTPSPVLAEHYRERLAQPGSPQPGPGPRLKAMLHFTEVLIRRPIEGDAALLRSLPAAGLSTPAVVALAQLIAFLSYQARLVAGLLALEAAGEAASAAALATQAASASAVAATASAGGDASGSAAGTGALDPIEIAGFTNATLGWRAWLDTVPLANATAEQIAVLEESHASAKTSDYYLFLVHQPEILRQRSIAFNAIMYAPGGMSRAERELGATVESRINGCVYCASVHAQRFEQLARRQDTIIQVFQNPLTAGVDARERAIVDFSAQMTTQPDALDGASVHRLRAHGLSDAQILDLIHSVAIFAWANRLMLNLGEPVRAAA